MHNGLYLRFATVLPDLDNSPAVGYSAADWVVLKAIPLQRGRSVGADARHAFRASGKTI